MKPWNNPDLDLHKAMVKSTPGTIAITEVQGEIDGTPVKNILVVVRLNPNLNDIDVAAFTANELLDLYQGATVALEASFVQRVMGMEAMYQFIDGKYENSEDFPGFKEAFVEKMGVPIREFENALESTNGDSEGSVEE